MDGQATNVRGYREAVGAVDDDEPKCDPPS